MSHTDDHRTLICSAVRAARLLPGTPHDSVPVRVATELFSVWEATEAQWPEWRAAGLATHTFQGGFPKSKHGIYILGIEDGASTPFCAPGQATCRWCCGDGLHPFLTQRWRQVLARDIELDPHSGLRNYPRLAIGVHQVTYSLTHYLRVAAGQGLDPLAIYGLELEAIRCPRCLGDGLRAFDWQPVAVAA